MRDLFLLGALSLIGIGVTGCSFDELQASGGGGVGGSTGTSTATGTATATSSGTGTVGAGGSSGEGGTSTTGTGSGGSTGSGPQQISIVSSTDTKQDTVADVPTLTLNPTPSAGNAIIVGITCLSTADRASAGDCTIDPGGVTDNQGNVYTRIIQGEPILSSEQGARSYIFIAENIGAPNGTFVISVDPVGTVPPEIQQLVWGAIQVAGLAAPPSFDASGSSLTASSTSTTAITDLPTVQANELAVGVLSMRSDDTNMLITPEGGWTTHHANQNGASLNPPGHSMISRVTTMTGQVSHTWTHDAPTRGAASVIATFRGALEN